MKLATAAIAVLCFALLPHAAHADAFYTKASGSAVSLSVWRAVHAGTITITQGSALVTGTGTEFTKLFLPAPGYANITSDDGLTVLGAIASVLNDTELLLAAPAADTYTDLAFTTESLPTLADDITINAGHVISALVGPGQSFGIHNIVIDGTLNVDAEFFNIAGDLTVNAGATLATTPTTRIVFDGISTIGGTASPIALDYFRLKSTAVITLAQSLVVNILEMEGGTILTGGNTLTVGTSAASPGAFRVTGVASTPPGLVIGTLTRWIGADPVSIGDLAGYFPMGAAAGPLPGGVRMPRKVWIAKSHAGSGTITMTHADGSGTTVFASPFTENALSYTQRHAMNWTITPGSGYAGLTDLRIQASGLDAAAFPPANLTLGLEAGAAPGTPAPFAVVGSDTVLNRSELSETDLAQTFYIAMAPADPLPVELVSFSAASANGTIVLRWKTASEKNNYGFEIERSSVGKGTTRQWHKIGFVPGAGTTNAPQSYVYADRGAAGITAYRLKQIDRDGRIEYSGEVEAAGLAFSAYELTQNYPNPFNPSTTIRFAVAKTGRAVLDVYNTLGQNVRTLFDGVAEAGMMHSVVFDAKDIPSGLYFYALRSGGRTEVKRMQFVK
ncbi:MAG: T9SS type A sorting domain-containing protein [Acidobacteriota bacterium]